MLRLSWSALTIAFVAHFVLSWSFLVMAQEVHLTPPRAFYYFYVVTASTVGYGDLSPQSELGKLIVSLFVIPGGISLFATLVGKITTKLVEAWRQNMKGQLDFNGQLHDHLIIMGWHEYSTHRMIELIFGDINRKKRAVVLVSSREMENPDPKRIHFVATANLASDDACQRAAVKDASRIIITGHNDENTLTTALKLIATGTDAHIVCHFDNPDKANLLKAHAPQVECHISTTTEMLVRSAQDPGSSRVQSQLLNTLSGPTQFSIQVPGEFTGCTFKDIITYFKINNDALALGIADSAHGNDLVLNPHGDHPIHAGQLVYYMASARVLPSEINWQMLARGFTGA
ncbi:potassium channel protein [Sansalvadorimonas verongulae]|uniref:potassium channel protein n=1 Tax=Sansalvadorimonas verongulae TaxID=2172824 RepID=UPI0018AD2C35|nr:potassium channel family protein [Sansalvadorimonas verongulae]